MKNSCTETYWGTGESLKETLEISAHSMQTLKSFSATAYIPNQYSDESLTTFKSLEETFPIIDFIIKTVHATKKSVDKVSSQKLDELINEVKELKSSGALIVKINRLETKFLRTPLDVIVEPDDEGYIARATEFPLFGYGDDRFEAVDALKFEIESLYIDLMEDDDFTDEWKDIKYFLNEQVINI